MKREEILAKFESIDTPMLVDMLQSAGMDVQYNPEDDLELSPDVDLPLEGWSDRVIALGADNRPAITTGKGIIRGDIGAQQPDYADMPYLDDGYDDSMDDMVQKTIVQGVS